MVADINLQVWLEADSATRPPIVTPYVQSPESQRIHYKLYAIKQGRSGTSRVGQSGTVMTRAGQPTALSQFSVSVGGDDKCRIQLTLISSDMARSNYQFDCPR